MHVLLLLKFEYRTLRVSTEEELACFLTQKVLLKKYYGKKLIIPSSASRVEPPIARTGENSRIKTCKVFILKYSFNFQYYP